MNLTQLPVKLEEAVSSVLKDITPEMKNSFSNILKELFSLTLEMPGRLNYTQLERMGTHTKKTYREAFSKKVDWARTPAPDVLKEQSVSLRDWYLMTIEANQETLHKISGRVTADAYFATHDFVDGLKEMGFDINSSRYADAPTSRKLAYWDLSLRKLAGAKGISA